MDIHMRKIKELQVERTIKALNKNKMEAHFLPSREEIVPMVQSLITPGDTIGFGGSVSLAETGVLDLLRSGEYTLLDRYKEGISREEERQVFLDSFSADAYFCSANAVTEHGELYCVDGNSNRVAAMLYGPKQVILIVSWDKIVPNLDIAIQRVKHITTPANTVRLGCDTHCATHGKCMSPAVSPDHLMALPAGACANSICANYVVFSHQKTANRMKVLLVADSFGY